jgi:predicted MPP superfamily phosphohydrolase
MKLSAIIIFFTIVLSIYGLVNFYIVIKGYHVLPKQGWYRPLFMTIMLFLISAYPIGRLLERFLPKGISESLILLGSYYLAMMAFAFFIILFIDLLRLGNHFLHYFPNSWLQTGSRVKWVAFFSTVSIVLSLTLIGAINARHIRVKELTLQIPKNSITGNPLHIVLASDIHLGTIIHNSRLEQIVEKINQLNPDIILLAGDVFDEDITSLMEKNTSAILANLKAKYGVYAVPGNHEYFSGIDKAIAYLQDANITVLRDSLSLVAGSFYIVGRDDLSGNRMNNKRKSLEELMKNVDKSYPVILMDHQPFYLEEAQQHGIDLQVSGHTHHGQLFPFNLITNRVYELSWGYLQKGDTHYYVSCGVGTWGPPVRLGNRPEIVKIELNLMGETP